MTPTEKLTEQIKAVRSEHRQIALSGMGREVGLDSPLAVDEGCRCGAGWPCDAIRLAEKLELAVKALEAEHRAAGLRNATKARRIIGEALAAIADLGEKEGETR